MSGQYSLTYKHLLKDYKIKTLEESVSLLNKEESYLKALYNEVNGMMVGGW